MDTGSNFEIFTKAVMSGVRYHLKECEIEIQKITKNNGVEKTALVIKNLGGNVEPCIYLEEYYRQFMKGYATVSDVVNHILLICKENEIEEGYMLDILTQYSSVAISIRGRLINTKMNTELLDEVPHRSILDLSLIYTIEIHTRSGIGNILIKKEHLALWEVTEEELFVQLQKNMEVEDKGAVRNIDQYLIKELGVPEEEILRDHLPEIYVLGYKGKNYGAVEVLNQKTIEKAEEIYHGSFYVLPSSVHELILLPEDTVKMELDQLAEMVSVINESIVGKSDVLSSHIYFYDADKRRLEIRR